MPGSELDSKVQRKGKVIRKVPYSSYSYSSYSYSYSFTLDTHPHPNPGIMLVIRKVPYSSTPIHSHLILIHILFWSTF